MKWSYIEALRQGLFDELERDGSVFVIGEDVATGGPFGITAGLAEAFGAGRVKNAPISEGALAGLSVGAALCGLRPVLEVMFIDFITLAMDALVNQAAKYRFMSGGRLGVPLVVRTQAGAAGGAGAQHSQSLESWFMHVPGLTVLAPANPTDAYGLLRAAIALDDPVVFVEHKRLYTMRAERDPVAETWPVRARVVRRGSDVTLVAYSAAVRTSLEAAERLAADGISVEVIDLRALVPLDIETLHQSVKKTHRVLIAHEATEQGGVGAEVAAALGAQAFDDLDAPIARVGAAFAPIGFAPELEQATLPGADDIERAARSLIY